MLYHVSELNAFLWPNNTPSYPVCMGITHFAYPLSVEGHLGCFHFLAIKNDSQNGCKHLCTSFPWTYLFNSFGCIPGMELLALNSFLFLRVPNLLLA